jgi:hypothetical protein
MGNKKHRILFKKEKNGTRINADIADKKTDLNSDKSE